MVGQPGARRNQPANNDVFLQAPQVILLTGDCRFGQHASGFLEGSRGYERFGRQRRLGDAQQHTLEGSNLLALRRQLLVDLREPGVFELFTTNQVRLTRIEDLSLTQHLPDDHLNVFVIDGHTLQPVHLLNLVDDVLGEFFDAFEPQNVM